MEWSLFHGAFIILTVCIGGYVSLPVRINYEKCDWKGFTCQNSKNITGKVDITFQCNTTVTTQDVLFYIWSFSSPATIASLTIKDCEKVQISFTCTAENKPMQWLKIENVGVLEILPAFLTHNPPEIYLENIGTIENIYRNTFSQIKYETYRPGCLVPVADLNKISFTNVTIANIETEAFRNLSFMKEFNWNNVAVQRISTGAIKLNFEGGTGELKRCKLGVVEPMAFQIVGQGFSISNGRFTDIWGSGFNGTIYDFYFTNNTVSNLQSSAISILSQNVYILDNHFETIESGAFQKISPGLLFDSKNNFGMVRFVYRFNNNLIENVEDGGIRPDVAAYKYVTTDMSYSSNTLQCSCDGLAWHGADVDLGFGFSVVKDFSNVILGEYLHTCSSTPCMCFGVKPPNRKNTLPVAVF